MIQTKACIQFGEFFVKKTNKKYCSKCAKLNANKRSREYRQNNLDKYKAYEKRYYTNNKQKVIERSAEWQKNNPDKHKQISRKAAKKWNAANIEKAKVYKARWYAKKKEIKNK